MLREFTSIFWTNDTLCKILDREGQVFGIYPYNDLSEEILPFSCPSVPDSSHRLLHSLCLIPAINSVGKHCSSLTKKWVEPDWEVREMFCGENHVAFEVVGGCRPNWHQLGRPQLIIENGRPHAVY